MIALEKRWNILKPDAEKTLALQKALNINQALCGILVQRGITSFEEAKHFFRPQLTDLHSPWLMKDMEKAVNRIITAFNNKEKILVYGDYDVDGTTSVACMYQFIQSQHEAVDFYIPHRYREGYGVSKAGIDFAHEHNFTLIVSLDCGIKSTDLIAYAATLGIDFVVCDHHLPDDTLPPAVAILNAKQKDCPYPFKELCGCGVGYKLITALSERLGLPETTPHAYLDLVATAIAADIVDMVGENRILAFYGLKKANENPNNGIRALCELSALKTALRISNLVFMIAPRVNAAGRMDDARKAVQLFVAKTYAEAVDYARQLHSDNSDRKIADSSTTEEALALIRNNPEWVNSRSTVLYQSHWHKGVVGIVASRIIEHFYRPTIILTQSGEYAAGSARSVPGFNLYEAVHACKEHLLGYGGHFAAAGMTLEIDQVEAFRQKFETVVAATMPEELMTPEITIDAEITLSSITPVFYKILHQMEPFGPLNDRPVFISRNVVDTGFSKVVKEQHIRFVIKQNDTTITGIGFGLHEKFGFVSNKQPFDIVYKIEENEWQGNKTLQMMVIDIKPASA
ncbi:single-stranded-DNA-specific exonuclease RecJ [Terrimonas rubra]|uniref:Single-stranded-DNA-specific exonuclease RecJ n=1 Tax=Terrimonas rubra TaxID=1035890 RepID=A0ABW6A3W2_9BACT